MPKPKDVKISEKSSKTDRKNLYEGVIGPSLAKIFSEIGPYPDPARTQSILESAESGLRILGRMPQQRRLKDPVPPSKVLEYLSHGALGKLFEGDHAAARRILQRVRELETEFGVTGNSRIQGVFRPGEIDLILTNIESLAQQLPGIRDRVLELEEQLEGA